jgi:hypothetical protein
MKKKILLVLSLVMLIGLVFALNVQPASADGTSSIQIVKSGIWKLDNTIDYTFKIFINPNNPQTLYDVTVSDPLITNIIWPTGVSHTLTQYSEPVIATGTYTVPDSSITQVTNTATATGHPLIGAWVSDDDTLTLTKPGYVPPVPELPAGVLLGVGLAGLGGFIFIKRCARAVASK